MIFSPRVPVAFQLWRYIGRKNITTVVSRARSGVSAGVVREDRLCGF